LFSDLYEKKKIRVRLARVSASGYHQISGGGVFISNSYIHGEGRMKPPFPLFIYFIKKPTRCGLFTKGFKGKF
jgi:hypothetical protein